MKMKERDQFLKENTTVILMLKLRILKYSLDRITSVAISNDNKLSFQVQMIRQLRYSILKPNKKYIILRMLMKVILFFIRNLFIYSSLDVISSVAISNDDKYIISGSWDHTIKIFDLETKQEVHHFKNAHEGNFLFYPIVIHLFFFR